jgi:hypothetical protein
MNKVSEATIQVEYQSLRVKSPFYRTKNTSITEKLKLPEDIWAISKEAETNCQNQTLNHPHAPNKGEQKDLETILNHLPYFNAQETLDLTKYNTEQLKKIAQLLKATVHKEQGTQQSMISKLSNPLKLWKPWEPLKPLKPLKPLNILLLSLPIALLIFLLINILRLINK